MSRYSVHKIAVGLLVALLLMSLDAHRPAKTEDVTPTRYLAFQIFTGSPSPNIGLGSSGTQPLSAPPSKSVIQQLVQDIISRIGTTGDSSTKLAFIIGPLSFDHTDVQIQQMIQDAFDIALELNIAVGFHIDDSMFWARRSDLWQDPHNVEWLDWDATLNTGRRIDWGPQPTKLAPQMCYNSPVIEAEVSRLSGVIGSAIAKGINQLAAQGKAELFAGVIVGWETQMGQDFDSGQLLGYCALTNRGFSRDNPPADLDAEREKVVQAFIEMWARGIKQAGVEPQKIYSHTAFASQATFDQMFVPSGTTYSQVNHFAPPDISFGTNYQPGFSTYPQTRQMEQLYDLLETHGHPAWASSEGSTVAPGVAESVIDTETYMGWMFNHGAALVNIFGWGVGTEAENTFWKAADNADAISAYRKFLNGEPLVEKTTDMDASIAGSLPDKIHRIQANLPVWLQAHPDQQSVVEPLLQQLDQALKDGRIQDAQAAADTLLQMIAQ